MAAPRRAEPSISSFPVQEWREALEQLESNLRAVTQSIAQLRESLDVGLPPLPAGQRPEVPAKPDASDAFDRLWQRLENEKVERPPAEATAAPSSVEERLAALLPQQYTLTVEDGERPVDLVQLHRALLRLTGPDDISLLSYANGTPVVSLRTHGELDVDKLSEAISETMDQDCELSQQEGRIRMRVISREKQGD